jgi:hypothetical protein
VGCRSLECVLEGAFFWKELACSGQWCCFSWFRVACRSRRRGGREDGRLRKTGAAGQRREEARGRTRKRQNEGYRKQAEARFQNKKKSPPRLRAPPLTVMENGERAVRARLQKSPRSPPNAFASPWHNRSFSPSCPRQHQPHFLPSYLFR